MRSGYVMKYQNQEACERNEILAVEPQNWGEESMGVRAFHRSSLSGVPVTTVASGLTRMA